MRYFSSPGSLRRPMYSGGDDPKGPGFPIRISTDQSSFAAPHGFSQRTTSFIASRCQGIHQTPLRRLIDPTSNGQRPAMTSIASRSPEDRTLSACCYPVSTTGQSNGPGDHGPHRTTSTRNPLPDRARPVITLFTMSNSQHGGSPRAYPDPATAGQGNSCFSIEPTRRRHAKRHTGSNGRHGVGGPGKT